MESKTPINNENEKLLEMLSGIKIISHEYVSQLETELADKDKQLAEARAYADHWKSECNALQRMVHEARAEIESKEKLIEQMREALKLALPEARSTHCEQTILAALAAERMKK